MHDHVLHKYVVSGQMPIHHWLQYERVCTIVLGDDTFDLQKIGKKDQKNRSRASSKSHQSSNSFSNK